MATTWIRATAATGAALLLASLAPLTASAQGGTYTTADVSDGTTTFTVVDYPNDGAKLSFSPDSKVRLLEDTVGPYTYAFKGMDTDGQLDDWEDWRKSYAERAHALAQQLTIEQIAGLMLFNSHERSPEAGLTDAQTTYLANDQLRNVLNAGSNDVTANVTWNNQMQAHAESLAATDLPYVPVNFSSDPRSTAESGGTYNQAGDISRWPSNLGLAATFDPDTMLQFASMSSAEYRAMGIGTALGPQIDLATEPRWLRVDGTFGENTELASAMAKAYVDGSQNTYAADGTSIGWGPASINTMIKHFPGDGAGEGGREAHMNSGKYAVYPGNNFDEHLKPFTAALDSMAVMSSYSIAIDASGDALTGNRVGSGYDKAKIDLLRLDNGYEGVICTDWGVTMGYQDPGVPFGTAWGMGDKTVTERHYAILQAGVDMFGNNDKKPVLEAYDMWAAEHGAASADARFRTSAERILKMFPSPGLYENPYLDLAPRRTSSPRGRGIAFTGDADALSAPSWLRPDGGPRRRRAGPGLCRRRR